MVVLVNLIRALLPLDILVGVVLVVGIDVPSLDELGDVLRLGEVVLSLEVAVLQEVLPDGPVLLAPLGLKSEVSHAEGVDGESVTIDEDAPVGCDGVAVGVEESVGVIEGAAVGRVGESLLGDEDVLSVHESHGG